MSRNQMPSAYSHGRDSCRRAWISWGRPYSQAAGTCNTPFRSGPLPFVCLYLHHGRMSPHPGYTLSRPSKFSSLLKGVSGRIIVPPLNVKYITKCFPKQEEAFSFHIILKNLSYWACVSVFSWGMAFSAMVTVLSWYSPSFWVCTVRSICSPIS